MNWMFAPWELPCATRSSVDPGALFSSMRVAPVSIGGTASGSPDAGIQAVFALWPY